MSNKEEMKQSGAQAVFSTLEFRLPRDKTGKPHVDWTAYGVKMAIMLGKGLLAILAADLDWRASAIILLSTAIDVSVGFFTDGRKRGVQTRKEDDSRGK